MSPILPILNRIANFADVNSQPQSTETPPAGLYLFPVPLSDAPIDEVIPALNLKIIVGIKHFIVENIRSARRFLRRCDSSIDIDSLTFHTLDEHTSPADVPPMLDALADGHPMGVISEAGCPAIADPGADVVAIAQRRGYKVHPLVGPSSIILGLMGSGFNGQSFAFNGYLPYDRTQRASKLKEMRARITRERQTQIFIETPYRNNRLITELASSLPGEMLLCVACDVTSPAATISTRPLSAWARGGYDYSKRPAIFLLFS